MVILMNKLSWKKTWSITFERLRDSFGNPLLVFYMLIFILGIGGLGLWIDAVQKWEGGFYALSQKIYQSVVTYSIAISVTALLDLIIRQQKSNYMLNKITEGEFRYRNVEKLVNLFIISTVCLFIALLSIIIYISKGNIWLIFIILLLTFFTWLYSNSDSDSFSREIGDDPSDIQGSDPSKLPPSTIIVDSEIPEAEI